MPNNFIPKDEFNKFFEQVCNALINKEFTDDRMANLTLEELLKDNGVEITIPDSLEDKIKPLLTKKINEDFRHENFDTEGHACSGCAACAICTLCGEVNGAAGAVGLLGLVGVM